jgi:GntR family galactonate operon transcriptional repressor
MPKSNAAMRDRPRNLVTSTLAKQILSGFFAPGAKLPTETELGEQLGVSRTALRESIRTLAGKGLIESRTRSGTVVLPSAQWNQLDPELLAWREQLEPDLSFVRSLTEARRVIEPAAARFAAARATGHDLGRMQESFDAMRSANALDSEASVSADEAFHLAVLAASHNAVFINFGSMIGSALRNAFRLTSSASESLEATLDMHGEVLEAIRMRQPDKAERRMADLLDLASRDLAKVIAQSGRQK